MDTHRQGCHGSLNQPHKNQKTREPDIAEFIPGGSHFKSCCPSSSPLNSKLVYDVPFFGLKNSVTLYFLLCFSSKTISYIEYLNTLICTIINIQIHNIFLFISLFSKLRKINILREISQPALARGCLEGNGEVVQ